MHTGVVTFDSFALREQGHGRQIMVGRVILVIFLAVLSMKPCRTHTFWQHKSMSARRASTAAGWPNCKERVEWGQFFPCWLPDHLQKDDGVEGI